MFGLFSSKRERYAQDLRRELRNRRLDVGERFHEYNDDARRRLGRVGDQLEQKGRHAWEYTDEALHDLDRHVHRKPWTYIATGTALGLITGLLIGRRY